MLVVMIHSAYGRLGAVLSALIVVLSILGLTMHGDFYASRPRRDFFRFYTNLSNLIVLLYFALIAPYLYASSPLRVLIPAAEFSVMMCIMLTFCVFHFMLFPFVRSQLLRMPRTEGFWIVCADNLILHYLVPLLVLAYWILCSPGKSTLTPAHALHWTIIPLAYIVCIFASVRCGHIIAETGTRYPYPFLNADDLGIRRVIGSCASLYALCILASLAVIMLLKTLFALLGKGHALFLI
ncbi:MAG: Pr6Pr family membrane protein [Clostridia bacterium]|nr:Pr6Pr family membrane protein [Clostridia bacterium]